jgi:hypothetical protein
MGRKGKALTRGVTVLATGGRREKALRPVAFLLGQQWRGGSSRPDWAAVTPSRPRGRVSRAGQRGKRGSWAAQAKTERRKKKRKKEISFFFYVSELFKSIFKRI